MNLHWFVALAFILLSLEKFGVPIPSVLTAIVLALAAIASGLL